ncbi:hypothetical protein D030_4186B, partial [Vibrio parahaemolyticus AQ3810]
CIALG